MGWTLLILLVVLTVVHGNPTVTVRSGSGPTVGFDQHPNSVPLGEDTQTTTEVSELQTPRILYSKRRHISIDSGDLLYRPT